MSMRNWQQDIEPSAPHELYSVRPQSVAQGVGTGTVALNDEISFTQALHLDATGDKRGCYVLLQFLCATNRKTFLTNLGTVPLDSLH